MNYVVIKYTQLDEKLEIHRLMSILTQILVSISVNNYPVTGALAEALAHLLLGSNYWEQLQYSAQYTVPEECCFEIVLECAMLNAVLGEFVASVVELVHVEFAYFCEGPILDGVLLTDALEYGFSGMILQWEQMYPLVFGRAARTGFRENYTWLKRMLAETGEEREEEEELEKKNKKKKKKKKKNKWSEEGLMEENKSGWNGDNRTHCIEQLSSYSVKGSDTNPHGDPNIDPDIDPDTHPKLSEKTAAIRQALQINMEAFHQQHYCSIIESARGNLISPQLIFWNDLKIENSFNLSHCTPPGPSNHL